MGPRRADSGLGETIMNGLRAASDDMSSRWNAVANVLNSEHVTMSDLLRVQLGLAQVSLQSELVSKVISKSTQEIDELVKLQ
jgi:type III secretion protein I